MTLLIGLFIGQSYFINDVSQNFLIFQLILNTFKIPAGLAETIVAWQSKRLLNEKIRTPTTSNNSLSPKLKWHSSEMRVEFKGSCLNQYKVTFTPSNLVNLIIVYELDRWSQGLNTYFTLKNCFSRTIRLR